MSDNDTFELVALILIGFVALLLVLDRVINRRRPQGPVERRRGHAVAARKSTTVALICVGLLVVALLLGRLLLGVMAVVGLAVFATLAVVRGRLAQDRRPGERR